jgi:hypothetical protein
MGNGRSRRVLAWLFVQSYTPTHNDISTKNPEEVDDDIDGNAYNAEVVKIAVQNSTFSSSEVVRPHKNTNEHLAPKLLSHLSSNFLTARNIIPRQRQ